MCTQEACIPNDSLVLTFFSKDPELIKSFYRLNIVDFLIATTQAQQKEACQHGTTLPLCHAVQGRLFCSVAGELSSVNSGELHRFRVVVISLYVAQSR